MPRLPAIITRDGEISFEACDEKKTIRRGLIKGICSGLLCLSIPHGAAIAEASETLLTIHTPTGNVDFRLSDFDALPQQKFRTGTVWTESVSEYSGPALSDVLAMAGLDAKSLRMQAANDYSVIIEREIIEADFPVIVTRIDGNTFTLRDRGPLWLMYPYDDYLRFRSETIFAASIWQLTDIFIDSQD